MHPEIFGSPEILCIDLQDHHSEETFLPTWFQYSENMDMEVLTSVDQLRKEVAEIRKLGKRWGFEDEEIDACISEVLDATNQPLSKPGKTSTGRFRKCLRCGFYAMVTFWLVVTSLYIAISFVDEKTMIPIVKPFMAFSYPLLRYSRILGLPLHQLLNISGYYHANCIVDNPWFDDSPDSCYHCRKKKMISDIPASRKIFWRPEMEAVVFREVIDDSLDFSGLKKMFEDNKSLLQSDIRSMVFTSNRPSYKTLSDLFETDNTEEAILKDKGFTFAWTSVSSLAANRVIRQLFGRPRFLGGRSEVSFMKSLVIQGPTDKPYLLPKHEQFTWYVQVHGSRVVKVYPSSKCTIQCKAHEVTLQPKDSVIFTSGSWFIELQPFDGDTISIGYMGNFN